MDLFKLFATISLDASEYESGVEQAKKSGEGLASRLKSGLASAGKAAAKGLGLIATAAGTAAGGLLALEQSTEEYRIAQGRLNTAFESAGYGAEEAQRAYSDFFGILGDTDRATEASQLLAKLADSEEDLAEWTRIAAGVNGTFGDSLPIESLIESANEAARTGTVVGTLADALNWAGTVGEDEFNAMLAQCSTEAERNELIMETLSGTYDDAADAFYRNNEALVASREAQAKMDEVLSQLGQTVSTVKGRLTADFLPAVSNLASAFNGVIAGAEGADARFSEAVSGLVQAAADQLPAFLSFGVQIITSLLSGVVQSIPTLVSAAPQIVGELGTALTDLMPKVADMGTGLLEQFTTGIENGLPDMVARIPAVIQAFLDFITQNLPAVLDKGTELLGSLISGITGAIPNLAAALPQVISAIVDFIADNLPEILSAGAEILLSLASGIVSAIPQLVAVLPQIIEAIVSGMGRLMGSVVDVGKDIVRGLWEGIASMGGWIADMVGDFVDGLVESAKSVLGIASPSKVFADMGKNMALGLGEGWESEYSRIRGDITGGMDFGTASVDFASSGMGVASAGVVNGVSSAVQSAGAQSFTFNLMLPDGSKLASYTFRPLVDYARANGTPILNPS